MADYQEAIGEKAFKCVDQLNSDTVSQFSTLRSFKESLGHRKILDKFYKGKNESSIGKRVFPDRGQPTLTNLK